AKVQHRAEQALACSALQPIETEFDFLHQGNLRFLVRKLANLARKEQAKAAQETKSQAKGKEINPFLPYDSELFVSNLTSTHLCLLNKYNVVDNHILIVTRAFDEQDSWLTAPDFEALQACMAEIDGLAFYNGGSLAGASQRHKHLQLVPLPMTPDGSALPLDALMQAVDLENTVEALSDLPFVHAAMRLSVDWLAAPTAGKYLLTCYRQLMAAIGLDLEAPLPDRPYNLLITRFWMLAVPRCQESYQSIPVNSLGFAGSLLVKNEEQMALLREIGPLTLLTNVACPS
ncbi:MAG: phosphorylase, partial [Cyanobacteria bacterium Co-bin8]|nr:phosphorylase [Cyanobacteria bacterium Co-bin8]